MTDTTIVYRRLGISLGQSIEKQRSAMPTIAGPRIWTTCLLGLAWLLVGGRTCLAQFPAAQGLPQSSSLPAAPDSVTAVTAGPSSASTVMPSLNAPEVQLPAGSEQTRLVLPAGPLLDVPSGTPFQDRMDRHLRAVGDDSDYFQSPPLPAGFTPWWEPSVSKRRRGSGPARPLELDTLLVEALQFSPQVQAIKETDVIRQTAIVEEEAQFDVNSFMESKFVRSSDPVGDTLTTGGPPRFRDSTWYYSAGTRKKTLIGGTAELSQRLGYRDNNSLFLAPTQQGNARLALSFTQPLLKGAGRTYNHSRILLAQLDTRAGSDEVIIGLQDHLLEVTQAYWDLYQWRAVLSQKERHYSRGRDILKRLEDRQQLDTTRSQILSAQAAVEVRYADLNRATMAIRNAESRIRVLVSAPDLYTGQREEYLPITPLANGTVPVSLREALTTALYYRADVDRAMQQTRMAAVRLNMAHHELLPALNLILETYVAGLEGRSNVGQAWQNQFLEGEPGYTAGLMFEVPWNNRAARVRHERRQAEMRQITCDLQATVDATMLEVEIAVRAAHTAYRDIQANYRSMAATQAEVEFLQDRWTRLPGDDRSASFLLEDLLRAQDRLSAAEFAFAQAQTGYSMAKVRLKRAMGVLLDLQHTQPGPLQLPATTTELPPPEAEQPFVTWQRLPPVP